MKKVKVASSIRNPPPPQPAHNYIELKIFLFSLVDLAHLFTIGYLKFLISQTIFGFSCMSKIAP